MEPGDRETSVDDILEEAETARALIRTRQNLADYADLLFESIRQDERRRKIPIVEFLVRIADTVADDRLSEETGGTAHPETPTWKTFGDIFHDAIYRP